ncbi:hypothetical protein FG386_003069 [Cryptosporidium ryanae]|uniref:uncharacterized protein n=1 Tax=Cryptosporidium ryanae TaxID=515981 RepID=UPI00351A44AA|nr:hypothetical protein FG386_003069 [Cryptosporidium ryanae]
MFLLPSIGKKNTSTESELESSVRVNVDRNNIRICSRCGDIFELDYGNEDTDDYENMIKGFVEYINLEKRYQYHFEDFLLQYIEVSIEKNNELNDSNNSIDDSLCLECIDYLIYGFKTLFEKNKGRLLKYSSLKESRTKKESYEGCDSLIKGWFNKEGNIDLIRVIKDYISDNNIDIKEIKEVGKSDFNDDIFSKNNTCCNEKDYVDMKDIVELRLNQNMELNLIQELRQLNSLKEGTEIYYNNLKNYLGRLQKMDILNTCFYIDSVDGIGRINGLRLCIDKNDFDNWNEINACFGLISLFLNTILEKYDLNKCIKPRGSYSTIYDSSTKKTWPLYGSKLCNSDYCECINFDNAVSCLVRLINTTFYDIVSKKTSFSANSSVGSCNNNDGDSNTHSYKLPFKYDKKENKLENSSINLLFNDKDSWNRAMKMMLFNLKWLLVVSCEN